VTEIPPMQGVRLPPQNVQDEQRAKGLVGQVSGLSRRSGGRRGHIADTRRGQEAHKQEVKTPPGTGQPAGAVGALHAAQGAHGRVGSPPLNKRLAAELAEIRRLLAAIVARLDELEAVADTLDGVPGPPRRLLYPVKEAAQMLGMDRSTMYARARENRLELLRFGGRTYVSAAELERYAREEDDD
jgi:excisionase family DNA binding protein